jgi:hypothetical protein
VTHSIAEVAQRYAVQVSTVRAWTVAGELVGFSVSKSAGSRKRRLRYTDEALADFEARRAIAPTPKWKKRTRRLGNVIQFYASK